MKALAVAACALTLAAPAFAQTNTASFHGAWSCQMTYAEYSAQGWQSGFTRNFQLMVSPDGQYQAQGMQVGIGGNEPFQSQGQWKAEGAMFSATGPEMLQTSLMGPMQSMFGAFGQLDADNRTMRYQYPQTPAGQQPQGPRTSYMCEKQG